MGISDFLGNLENGGVLLGDGLMSSGEASSDIGAKDVFLIYGSRIL